MPSKNYQQLQTNKTLSQLIAENEMITNEIKTIGNRIIGRCEKIETELTPMGIGRTVYPYDYDKNNSHENTAFNNWANHIRTEQNADFAKSIVS